MCNFVDKMRASQHNFCNKLIIVKCLFVYLQLPLVIEQEKVSLTKYWRMGDKIDKKEINQERFFSVYSAERNKIQPSKC